MNRKYRLTINYNLGLNSGCSWREAVRHVVPGRRGSRDHQGRQLATEDEHLLRHADWEEVRHQRNLGRQDRLYQVNQNVIK